MMYAIPDARPLAVQGPQRKQRSEFAVTRRPPRPDPCSHLSEAETRWESRADLTRTFEQGVEASGSRALHPDPNCLAPRRLVLAGAVSHGGAGRCLRGPGR